MDTVTRRAKQSLNKRQQLQKRGWPLSTLILRKPGLRRANSVRYARPSLLFLRLNTNMGSPRRP
jgi:hypothetical protein